MLKLKSKAIKLAFAGLMVAAFAFVGTLQVSADMITLPSTGVKATSSMSSIQSLQTFLNWTLGSQITPLVVDGKYGAKTTAAIKLYQAQNSLTVDGKFGPMSAAKAMALQAGGSTGGSTAGTLCPNGMTLASNCMSAPGTTTVSLCPNGMTIASNCMSAPGGTTVSTGTNGYLADLASDSTGRVSTVYESQQDKVVAGFRATARLASQNVTRVRVTFLNTNGAASSANLAKYISGASLWYGSTKIASMAVTDADRQTSDDTYTFNFSGLNANIAKDQIGRFYVSVNSNGSIDTGDTDATWTVSFPVGGTLAVSPDGTNDTYPTSTAISVTNLGFNKFAQSGEKVTVGLSTSSPAATTVPVSSTANTNEVTVLKFTVKAENSDMTLKKVPVQILSSAANVSSIINTIKLYRDGTLVDSLDGSTVCDLLAGYTNLADCSSIGTPTNIGYVFSNLSDPYNKIASGSTAEFAVVADLKKADGVNYSAGNTLTASLTNTDVISATNTAFSVQDVNGDQVTATSTYRVGSAVGQAQTLRVNGVNTVMGTPTYSNTVDSSGVITSVSYSIPVSVTAFGQTLYVGQSAQLAATATASNAFAVVFQTSAAPTSDEVTSSASLALSSTDATLESNGFRLDSGVTKHFTITVNLTTPSSVNSNYRVAIKQIQTFTEGLLLSGTNNNLLPVEQYRTDYKLINS